MNDLTQGIDKADSWSVDGHKTLNNPYDSGIVLSKDKEALISAMQATGSYIVYGIIAMECFTLPKCREDHVLLNYGQH